MGAEEILVFPAMMELVTKKQRTSLAGRLMALIISQTHLDSPPVVLGEKHIHGQEWHDMESLTSARYKPWK